MNRSNDYVEGDPNMTNQSSIGLINTARLEAGIDPDPASSTHARQFIKYIIP